MDQLSKISPAQIEFLAEDTLITIVPRMSMEILHFLSGDFGPFEPLTPIEVPLWLAIALKKRKKCSIHPPPWLSVDVLKGRLLNENDEERRGFDNLPYHYIEISTQLLTHAAEDIPNSGTISTLLEDLRTARAAKVRKGLLALTANAAFLKLTNLSAIEINSIRDITVQTFNQLVVFRKKLSE